MSVVHLAFYLSVFPETVNYCAVDCSFLFVMLSPLLTFDNRTPQVAADHLALQLEAMLGISSVQCGGRSDIFHFWIALL